MITGFCCLIQTHTFCSLFTRVDVDLFGSLLGGTEVWLHTVCHDLGDFFFLTMHCCMPKGNHQCWAKCPCTIFTCSKHEYAWIYKTHSIWKQYGYPLWDYWPPTAPSLIGSGMKLPSRSDQCKHPKGQKSSNSNFMPWVIQYGSLETLIPRVHWCQRLLRVFTETHIQALRIWILKFWKYFYCKFCTEWQV